MFWQQEYIRKEIAITNNSTFRLDLPENGVLGSLLIKISALNVDAHGEDETNWRILDHITKMEIILNGATICKSLAGDLVQAIAFYDNGVSAPDIWRNYGAHEQTAYFLIDFGRYLYDPLLGLNLNKFKNAEIRITNDAAAATDLTAMTLSLLGFYMREGPASGPLGYLRTEEWREYTTVQAAIEYLDLPTEHQIRRIILQGRPALNTEFHVKRNFWHMMEDIELNLDTGQTRVHKGPLEELIKANLYAYRHEILTGGEPFITAGDAVETGIGQVNKSAHGAGHATALTAATIIHTVQSTDSSNTQVMNNWADNEPIRAMWSGCGYHNSAVLKFDWDEDPNTWLDPKGRATVELNIQTENNANAAGGTNKVVLDRLVRT